MGSTKNPTAVLFRRPLIADELSEVSAALLFSVTIVADESSIFFAISLFRVEPI